MPSAARGKCWQRPQGPETPWCTSPGHRTSVRGRGGGVSGGCRWLQLLASHSRPRPPPLAGRVLETPDRPRGLSKTPLCAISALELTAGDQILSRPSPRCPPAHILSQILPEDPCLRPCPLGSPMRQTPTQLAKGPSALPGPHFSLPRPLTQNMGLIGGQGQAWGQSAL